MKLNQFAILAFMLAVTACQQSSFTSKGGLRPVKLGGNGEPAQGGKTPGGGSTPTDPRDDDTTLTEGADATLKVIWRAPETTEHDFGPWRRGSFKFEIERTGASGGTPVEVLSFDSNSSRSSLKGTRATEKVIQCGKKNSFKLTITADGQTKSLSDWSQELISSYSRPNNASDWEDFLGESLRHTLSGTNQTIFIGGFDHGVPGEKCGGSNFVCDNREWNNRDDFQGIFTMDLSKCEQGGAGTEIEFEGMQGL